MVSDTHPDIERIQIQRLRDMPAWRKIELVVELSQMAIAFTLAGLRQRYPGASEAEIQRRLADIIVGPELAEKAYGPLDEVTQSAR